MKNFIYLILFAGFSLTGCMMGMTGHEPHSSNDSKNEKVVKEVIIDKVKLTVDFPSVEVGGIAQFTIKVVNTDNNLPLSMVSISIGLKNLGMPGKYQEQEINHNNHQAMSKDSSAEVLSSNEQQEYSVYEHLVNIQGSYVMEHHFNKAGHYLFTVSVIEIEGEKLIKPIILEIEKDVKDQRKPEKKFLGMHSMTGYGILIGSAMIVMMAIRVIGLF